MWQASGGIRDYFFRSKNESHGLSGTRGPLGSVQAKGARRNKEKNLEK